MQRIRLTKEFKFEMAHALKGYDGLCRNIHGHSYELLVTIKGVPISDPSSAKLGMVMDFGDLKKIASDLDSARTLCPTFGPAVATAGNIRQFYLHDPAGAPLIEKAVKLWPNDDAVFRASAQLSAERGDWDRAMEMFSRAIAIQPGSADEAVRLLVSRYHQPERAVRLIGESSAAAYLVQVLRENNADVSLVNQARHNWIAQELRRLQKRVVLPEEWIAIAQQFAAMDDMNKADEYFRRAVDSSAASSATRLQYAEFLGNTGRIDDALRQIEVVFTLDPFNESAVQLQRRLRTPQK